VTLIKGLGPVSYEGGGSPASSTACRGGEGGRLGVEATVASSFRPTVVVWGWRSYSASTSSLSGVRGCYCRRSSSSSSASAGSMVEAVAAAVDQLASDVHQGSFSPAVCDSH
jgi:hypothetical protein